MWQDISKGAGHKCIEEQSKSVHQQQSVLQCSACREWFRSRGGLAVHNCQMLTLRGTVSVDNEEHNSVPAVGNSVYCHVCKQTFNRPGDLKRHKYLAERS